MKKIIVSTLILFIAIIALPSCRKDVVQSEVIKEIIIDTTIQAGSVFQLNLAPVWDTTKMAAIIEQSSNFTVSQIDNSEGTTAPIYRYSSSLPSGSTDKVTLSISDLNDGKRILSKDSTIIYLNLTIQ